MPTDTIYGIVAQALNKEAVERVYAARKRSPEKPCIILIADLSDLHEFGIWLWWKWKAKQAIKRLWPGAVSIIFPCSLERFAYLHRHSNTLAFRLPHDEKLRALIRQTGPLIAPSANPEGLPPAKTIAQAQDYFAGSVDLYEDAGTLDNPASTLVTIESGRVRILRQGSALIPTELL